MKNAIGKLAIAAAVVAIAISQTAAVTIPADSVSTAWRGKHGTPPSYSYYIIPGYCDVAYQTVPESIGHGYGVFNLTSVLSATSCTLKFTATKVSSTGDCQVAIYCPGTNLSRDPQARWEALATGPLLASPTFSGNGGNYVCTFDPNYLPLDSNYVFLAWDTSTWDQYWRVTNARLIFH